MFTISSIKTIHDGFVGLKKVTRSDGQVREVATAPDSVGFLVYNKDRDELIFVSQCREPMLLRDDMGDGTINEAPAGHLEKNLGVKATVVKEACEELGLEITEEMVTVLNHGEPLALSPGVLTEVMYLCVVIIGNEHIREEKKLYGLAEEGEFISKLVMPRSGLIALIPRDMKTWALIQWFLRTMNPGIVQRKVKGAANVPPSS